MGYQLELLGTVKELLPEHSLAWCLAQPREEKKELQELELPAVARKGR